MKSRLLYPTLALAAAGWIVPDPAVAQAVTELQVAPATAEVAAGGRTNVLVTAYDGSGNVVFTASFQWSSSDESVVRVELDPSAPQIASLIGVGPGTATVTVSSGSAVTQIAVSVSGVAGPVGVGPAAGLRLDPNPLQLLPTEEVSIVPRFLRADGELAAPQSLTFRSLLPSVAAVDGRGRVVGISAGQGVVEAASSGGLVARVIVQVSNESFAFDRSVVSLSPAASESLFVLVPTQGNRRILGSQLQWGSSNAAVVNITTQGVATGISPGRAQVIAQGFGQIQRVDVVVHRPVSSMDVSPTNARPVIVPMSGTTDFEVTFNDANDRPVPEASAGWLVGDPNILSFDPATATATGVAMGTTTLTMRGPSGLEYTWDIEVVGGGVAVERRRMGLSPGQRATLSASFVDQQGNVLAPARGLTWTSSAPNVAQVGADGTVTARAFGRTTVVAGAAWGAADTVDVFVQGQLLVTKFPGGGGDVYSLDIDSLTFNQITTDVAAEVAARYSPDGGQIAFVSTAEGAQKIYIIDADGTNTRRLTDGPGPEGSPAWTPDGSRIVYESGGDLWSVQVDGSDAQQLTTTPLVEDRPVVSPDGGTVAYMVSNGTNSDVWLMNTDGSQQRPFAQSEGQEMFPSWQQDGRLLYVSEQGRGRDRVRRVVRATLTSGEVEPITSPELVVESFATSLDGTLLALTVALEENGRLLRKLFLLRTTGPDAGTAVEVPRADPFDEFFFPAFRR